MKKIGSLFVCLAVSFLAQAQDTATVASDTSYWTNRFKGGINFNQATFSDNWTGGGVNSVAFGVFLNASANYLKDRWSWGNAINAEFGLVQNQGQSLRKSVDKIILDTKVAYSFNDKLSGFASMNFLTQFAQGFQYEEDANGQEIASLVSDLFAPAFITTALGFQYQPVDYFSVSLGLFAPRLTIVAQDSLFINVPENYGVARGENTRFEWAASQLMANFDKDLSENLNLNFRYQLFANYEQLTFDQLDHRLDASLTAKVAKFVNVNLTGILLYDKDQDDDVQISQALAIGLVYQISNRKKL